MTELSEALRQVQIDHTALAVPSRTPPHLWRLAALIALLVIGAAWLILHNTGHAGPQPKVVQLTAYQGSVIQPSFSPDGSQVAFSWNGEQGDNFDIYVKLVGENHALRLTTDPANDRSPAWSPDGKRIAFLRFIAGRPTSVWVVSPLGGVEQKIANFPGSGHLTWSPDGKWLAVGRGLLAADPGPSGAAGVFLVPLDGSEPRRVTSAIRPGNDDDPALSPDGRSLAYDGCARTFSCDVYLQDLNPDYSPRGLPRRITRQQLSINGIAWAGDSLVYSASPSWGTLFHLWRLGLHGENPPERLDLAGLLASSPSVAPTAGRLAFSRVRRNLDIWRFRPSSPPTPLIASSLDDLSPQFSPDGSKIVFTSARSGETFDIWIVNADGSNPVQLTDRKGRGDGAPRWSPDGDWIVFDSQRPDGFEEISVVDATGGRPRQLTTEPCQNEVPNWSRDGKWIYFGSDRTGRFEIWRVLLSGGKAERVTNNGGRFPFESVDGKTLFYLNGRALFAKQLPEGLERQIVDFVGLSRDIAVFEDGIYYGGRFENGQTPIWFYEFSTHKSWLITRVDGQINQGLAVSPDRSSFLYATSALTGSDLMLIENFR